MYSMHCCRERSCVSPSILKQYSKPPKSLSIPIRLCVGLPDYCACVKCTARRSTMESVAKRPKLSLSLPKNRGKTRFGAPLSSDKMGLISKGKRSAYTERSTSWAVTTFKEWIRECNEFNPDDLCPDGFLELDHSSDVPQLERWLCRFVVEARKQDGQHYPPTTLQSLLSGILRYMREQHGDTPDFLSKKDWRFRGLRGTIESTYSELRKNGIGAEVKHTPIVTKEEEDQLWRSGVMGTDTPKQLLQTVFFYVGKVFCLRGGVEQRGLKVSQFQRKYNPEHYVYIENGSKNNSGANVRVENKVVPVYANLESGQRCLVPLLDNYISKLPPVAFEKDAFYMRPKPVAPSDATSPWYDAVPVGKESLHTMLPKMCETAGIEHKSNHSLRATGATEMFAANVPEKLIQSRTGHRSVDALRLYERPSADQNQAVSNILTSREHQKKFDEELSNVQSATSGSVEMMVGSNSFGKDVTNVRSFASQSNSLMSTVQNRSALFGSLNHCNVNINFNIPSRKSEDCLMENMPL